MPITHLDLSFYRSPELGAEAASYVAFNPRRVPGSLVMAGSCAVRDSIGSQVACKLALQYFVEGVMRCFEGGTPKDGLTVQGNRDTDADNADEASLKVLEEAFKNANNSVYNFGHQLAAGGRMAASLLGLVIEGDMIAVGRVGEGSAYLGRFGELFPFFEAREVQSPAQLLDAFVGSHSMVSVELASVAPSEADILFVCSRVLDQFKERELASLLHKLEWEDERKTFGLGGSQAVRRSNLCAHLIRQLFPAGEEIAYAMVVLLGPDTIFLK